MIELSGVAKTFDRGAIHALQDVTFSVPTGSVCALLGHNGAGKTTTIKILSTLLRPTSGKAIVAGYDVVDQPGQVRASISMAGQITAMDPLLTGRENLVLFGRLRGLRRRQAKARADELIEQFDLADAADRQVTTYSGGMWRRVDLASSLVVPVEGAFPRRADHRAGPAQPPRRVGTGELVGSAGRRRVADHAVFGRGRRAE